MASAVRGHRARARTGAQRRVSPMRWNQWRQWIRLRPTDDFAAEVESHIQLEVERLMRDGMSEEEARFAARRAFGNTTTSRENFHEARLGHTLESIGQD